MSYSFTVIIIVIVIVIVICRRWGWAEFMSLDELELQDSGFVANGCAIFETKLQVLSPNPYSPCADCLCTIEQQDKLNSANLSKTNLCSRHFTMVHNSLLEFTDECREKLSGYSAEQREVLLAGWNLATVEKRRTHLPKAGTTAAMIEERFRDNYLAMAVIYIACQDRFQLPLYQRYC
jgi:dsDNA-binding SOS-regulon protein